MYNRVGGGGECITVSAAVGECQFSHLWVLFVFHENTDAASVPGECPPPPSRRWRHWWRVVGRVVRTAGGAKNGGARTFRSKIEPPVLCGHRVGIFATRT